MREPPVILGALPQGGTVAVQPIDFARSVHLGVWLRAGARHEAAAENGLSHFLEHMVFKGGRRRDARGLAREIEALGGRFDAYTTHDLTCYTLQSLPEHLDRALDVLAELIIGHRMDPELLATERQVVLEEILEAEDAPGDLVQELCAAAAWADHPLGRPVLGTAETVAEFTAEQVERHRARLYTRDRLLLAAVGQVGRDALTEAAASAFADLDAGPDEPEDAGPVWTSGMVSRRMAVDQIYLCLAAPGLSLTDPDRYALWLLDALLGATMSSRLFQEVREARGLCYQIASASQSHREAGLMTIEAVAHPKQIGELLKVTRGEIESLVADGVNDEDLDWVKHYSRTTVTLGAESVSSQLGRLARNVFFEGRQLALAEVLADLDSVTAEDVQRVAQRIFGAGEYVLGVVGPVTDKRAEAWRKVVMA